MVVDPFAGSGMTGLAAMELGRDCVLVDNNKDYAKLAYENLRNARHEIPFEVELVVTAGEKGHTHHLLDTIFRRHRERPHKASGKGLALQSAV